MGGKLLVGGVPPMFLPLRSVIGLSIVMLIEFNLDYYSSIVNESEYYVKIVIKRDELPNLITNVFQPPQVVAVYNY